MSKCIKYRAIIFDFDGTLVESSAVKSNAFRAMYMKYGDDIASRVYKDHLQNSGVSRYIKFERWERDILGRDYDSAKGEMLSESFSQHVLREVITAPVVVGAFEFLQEYSHLIPLFIASGTPTNELRNIADQKKMSRYFQGIYGSPESKENIINRICHDLGCMACETLVIGDAMADYEGAASAGANFIGRHNEESPVRFPECIPIIQDLKKLHEYI